MSTPVTAAPTIGTSPHAPRSQPTQPPRARLLGVVYLLFFVTAILGVGFMPATAAAIQAHEAAFWAGYACTLLSTALYVAVTMLLARLFRPVDGGLASLAAGFGLVGCAISAVGSLFRLVPLAIAGDGTTARAFTAEQVGALAQLSLDVAAQASRVSLVFFGAFLLLLGALLLRATFLPRLLGVPTALAGLGWLTFLVPPLAGRLLLPIEALGVLAEAALMLWLLARGVDADRWTDQARASETSRRA